MASTHRDVAEDRSEDGSSSLPDCGDSIDAQTFEQILEMDDDEDEREFSRSIVYGFFDQAEGTFKKMESSLAKSDLPQLHSLGHFLKGSSATIGLIKVKDGCEKIQNFGGMKDATGNHEEPDPQLCLRRIQETLPVLKEDYKEVEKKLKQFYHDSGN
ncbi:hypothetical protein MMC30_001131 [Trapelia coarctata]|nr:hypothetical protein [Trapelia coarctata]